ncbi:MAG: hypothetical protein AAGE93_20600 [Bacteroidota bacterium]
MKLAPLAASILGCAWLLTHALNSPKNLSDIVAKDAATVDSYTQSVQSQISDSTAGNIISYQQDSTTDFKVLIVPID